MYDPSGWVNGNADAAGGFLPVVCTLNAAKVTDTFARLLNVGHEELSVWPWPRRSPILDVLSSPPTWTGNGSRTGPAPPAP